MSYVGNDLQSQFLTSQCTSHQGDGLSDGRLPSEPEAPVTGEILPFGDYLVRSRRRKGLPVIWRWSEIEPALDVLPHAERGSIALADPGAVEPATVAPGLSLTVQVVPAGATTSAHAHSFWHLYFVRSGAGIILLGKDLVRQSLKAGDTILVPAWCAHKFDNNGDEALILFALQNLPQNANLGSLLREEADGELRIIYDEPRPSREASLIWQPGH